jgi:hypothetical protein
VIEYSRGQITVLDRPKLEQLCCECYAVVKKESDRLLPRTAPQWGDLRGKFHECVSEEASPIAVWETDRLPWLSSFLSSQRAPRAASSNRNSRTHGAR